MLSCILLNLVYNAIKFTPSGGTIWLDAKIENEKTEIVVVDSGLGMSLKQKDELFRHPKATAGTFNELGTGIGLIICKDFVDKHMGNINIESEPGRGTRVMISIPNSYVVIE
jgi:signal transduction histidine kinase